MVVGKLPEQPDVSHKMNDAFQSFQRHHKEPHHEEYRVTLTSE